jgi:hypothetical protein
LDPFTALLRRHVLQLFAIFSTYFRRWLIVIRVFSERSSGSAQDEQAGCYGQEVKLFHIFLLPASAPVKEQTHC